jgi:DNA-binding response OmpR family regulator
MKIGTILLVEDDTTLGYILSEYLEMNQFNVIWAKDGKEGLENLKKADISLCLIDIMMPEMDGFEVAKQISHLNIRVPIIFLTARSLKIDKLKGFHLGADDYITKPVDEEELLARIHAVLRRSRKAEKQPDREQEIYQIGGFQFTPFDRRLIYAGEGISITEKESRLLEMLAQRKNQLLLRIDALKHIWGSNDYFTRKSMDVHIHKLRRILSRDPDVSLINVHGKGFILKV